MNSIESYDFWHWPLFVYSRWGGINRQTDDERLMNMKAKTSKSATDATVSADAIANPRPPFPPFNAQSATQKVRMAEDAWNTRDPERVSLAYTQDSVWR